LCLGIYTFIIDSVCERISKNISLYLILAGIPAFLIYIIVYKSFWWFNYFAGFLLLSPILGLCISLYINKNIKRSRLKLLYYLVVLFGILCVTYGLGSNNSIFMMMSFSSFFLVLALLALLGNFSSGKSFNIQLITVCATTLIISMGIVHTTFAFPFRQPAPLWDNDARTSIQENKGELILSKVMSDYVVGLRDIAKKNGFEPGFGVIDLSGNSIGSIYVLDSYTPKNAWIAADLRDKTDYFRYVLSTIPCEEIIKAWLLFDDSVVAVTINPKILLESGLAIETDYIVVGSIPFARWFRFGNRYYISQYYLAKPIKNPDEALAACYNARKNSKF
jgi:hypothetical protein